MLSDDEIIKIAKEVATANDVGFVDITTEPAIDSEGAAAVMIKIAIPTGSAAGLGSRTARTVSQLIGQLADAGEQRFPIIRYEGKGAAP